MAEELVYDIEHMIKQKWPQLTRGQRAVADYIVHHMDDVAFLSITELARRIGVSEATLVRFARELDLGGYPDLKNHIQERLKDRLASARKIETIMSDLKKTESPVKQVLGNQILYLRAVLDGVSEADFATAGQWIAHANTVYLYGDGVARIPIESMQFWLLRFGMRVIKIDHGGRRVFDNTFLIDAGDVVVVFGFGRDYSDVSMLLDWSRSQGAKSVLVTDVPFTGMASMADKVIAFERGPVDVFSSMAVPVAVADALVASVTDYRTDSALASVRKLDQLRKRYGFL